MKLLKSFYYEAENSGSVWFSSAVTLHDFERAE